MATEQIQNGDQKSRKEGLSEAKRLLLEKRMAGIAPSKKEQSDIARRPADVPVPLSVEQRRIWLHASQYPDLAIYNEPITIHRHGSFDFNVFEASFSEIVQRHEAWRTSFSPEGEAVVHKTQRVSLPFTDVSYLAEEVREAEALRVAAEDAKKPLALDAAPLFHARVVRLAPDEHRLYLTLNHIIFDGVSLSRILVPELAAIYAAFEQGEPSPLPEPKLQYGDYAYWSKQQVDSPSTKQHLAYWLKQLSGDLPVLRLPWDRPRPVMPSHNGLMHRFWIQSELMDDLKELSRANNTTLYVTLLAAFKVLLFRYSSQNDIIVGSPIDARRRPELADVLGYFLDTVAIRTRPFAQLTFNEFLAQTRDTVLEAFAAADVPFDRVVHEVKPPRDNSHHPIFQAFFSMRPVSPAFPAGWDLSHIDIAVGTIKFDIYLELGEQPDHLEGRFLYSTDLFDPATMKRIESHWFTLLQAICRQPETALSDLPILTSEERTLVLGSGGCNDTSRPVPQMPVQALFEERVRHTPNAIAVAFGEKQFTYRQLNARSEAIADLLKASGVTRGSIVAVAIERSLDLIAGLIAILKLRAAYLPLDIQMPRERIGLCLTDAAPSAVLTQNSLLTLIPPMASPVLLVDTMQEPSADTIELNAPDFEELAEALDDTAYVIYTSGTTGAPKAVEISQRNFVNLLTSMRAEPGFGPQDILLALTAISFDIAALELFLPLIAGGRVVIASRTEVLDPYLLGNAIKQSGCTVIQATPSTWRTLLLSGWKDALHSSGSALRILCGGEALTSDLADRLLVTGAELWNMYGPTETTIWSMVHHILPQPTPRTGPVSVGLPIANTQAYILDAQRQLLPLGAPGELFLGGMGLAKGYRGQPVQTAERFFTVNAIGGARLYNTGDLAVRKADGTVDVLGRTDNQVKIRGYRVELEAVESAALQHPQVGAAAARVWPEPAGGMRLSVYLVGKGSVTPNLAEMRDFLAKSLPEYMIPSDVVSLSELPLNSNGKTDRSRLPVPVQNNGPAPAVQFSAREMRLASIWTKLLGIEQPNLDDNFFSLGGHSVLVAALQQSIASEFEQRVPMAELFHKPTIRLQAELLHRLLEQKPLLPPGVFALQTQGSGDPIFWVHYSNEGLAAAMGKEQPFISIVLTVEDMIALGDQPTLKTIAMFHMQKILATQPKGPYRIGGFCVGGVLAYEVASLLRKAGYEVPLLILVDSPNPFTPLVKKVFRYCRWILGRGGMPAVRWSLEKLLDDQKGRLIKKTPQMTEMRTAQDMVQQATSKYQPPKYEEAVLLIQASERLHMDLFPAWHDVAAKGLLTQYVDGHHDDLMKGQNVQEVATSILAHPAFIHS